MQWWYTPCGSNKAISDLIEGPFHEVEPIANTSWVTKNLKLGSSYTYGKSKYYYSNKSIKIITTRWLLVTFFYIHLSVPCLVIIREASSCSGWEKYRDSQPDTMQRWETLEYSSLNGMSLSIPSPWGSRKICIRGRRKNFRARGNGGQQKNKILQINMIQAYMNSQRLVQHA